MTLNKVKAILPVSNEIEIKNRNAHCVVTFVSQRFLKVKCSLKTTKYIKSKLNSSLSRISWNFLNLLGVCFNNFLIWRQICLKTHFAVCIYILLSVLVGVPSRIRQDLGSSGLFGRWCQKKW